MGDNRIIREINPASRLEFSASMNGPVPVGRLNTLYASTQVSAGCPTSFKPTSGHELACAPARFLPGMHPAIPRPHGVVASTSMSRKCSTGSASPSPLTAQPAPASTEMASGFMRNVRAGPVCSRARLLPQNPGIKKFLPRSHSQQALAPKLSAVNRT